MTFKGASLREIPTAILTAVRFKTEVNGVIVSFEMTLELEIFAADVAVEGGWENWVCVRVSVD